MFKPEYNAHIVIVELAGGGKAYAFQHEDGTFYQIDTFEPLPGDAEVISYTDTVAAYNMVGNTVTEFSTFILQENIVSDDDEWVV